MEGAEAFQNGTHVVLRRPFNSRADVFEPSVRNSLEFLARNNSYIP